MLILDGIKAANALAEDLKKRVSLLSAPIQFTIVQVGAHEASSRYIKAKKARAEALGISVKVIVVAPTTSEAQLIALIQREATLATGLIVQLPLPPHFQQQRVLNAVPFIKDIDGLATHNDLITPATPRGIMALLDFYQISVKNQVVGVVGQSKLVGQPVASLCEQAQAKQVLRFNRLTGLAGSTAADILIVAAGAPHLIKREHIKPGVVIIDVGINTIASASALRQIVGDVDRLSVGEVPRAISPVPGGVGPMTVISLLANLVDVAEKFSNQT